MLGGGSATVVAGTLGWTLAVSLTPHSAVAAPPRDDLIGVPTIYLTRAEDTLLDIAHDYDIGYVAIRAANLGIDPWLPGAGRRIVIPTQHLLPDAPHRGIVINLPELRLYYYPPGNKPPVSFPLGIGGEGKETPAGHTQVVRKQLHPTWYPTKSEREESPDLPTVVPAGPDNPMGDAALYLGWKGYAIHGTNKPYSIGRRDSHGCIRMYPEDILALFKLVQPGTPVTVVNEPVKLGWSGGELYLEIHPDQEDIDELEANGSFRSTAERNADDDVLKAAGDQADRLDWYRIHLVETERSGVAQRVTMAPTGQ